MKNRIAKLLLTLALIISSIFATFATQNFFSTPAYAEPDGGILDYFDSLEGNEENDNDNSNDSSIRDYFDNLEEDREYGNEYGDGDENFIENILPDSGGEGASSGTSICQTETHSLGWIFCSAVHLVGNAIDSLYNFIADILAIEPITSDQDSAIYQVWNKARQITNIVFVIVMLIVIYSQLTGVGLNNYGIKKVLPRLIIAAILVNLSFFITSILVDVSNIIGSGITNFFNDIIVDINIDEQLTNINWSSLASYLTGIGGAAAAAFFLADKGIGGIFWLVVVASIGVLLSVAIGVATISLRQGVVSLLVMVSPLAFVAYLMPNTEKWFEKWKNLLFQMIFFYPMFSLLYSASKLAGFAIINASGGEAFKVLVGLALQIMPLFLSVSLLKMSNTILGKVSSGLDKIFNPLHTSLSNWGNLRAEQQRQHHLMRNATPSARLRNYLAYRQKLREGDIEVSKRYNESRALARAIDYSSGSRKLSKDGKARWHHYANNYTRRQKLASIQDTLLANSQQNLTNNLSSYGDIFRGKNAAKLGNQHGEAFVDSMVQQFRAENIAQGDQSFLLNRYLDANTMLKKGNPYEYNRLIKNASGGLGHIGEASIMGQVISRSVEIESRRRREALVVANKFGFKKSDFRGMLFNIKSIDDNGFEVDDDGNPIEDTQYRLLPGKTHRDWDKFIAVDKKTGDEITSEQYLKLSPTKQAQYRKVRYIDITDDNEVAVQHVFEDDAAYIKELIRKDIAIGDPINRRYATEIGLGHNSEELAALQAQFPDVHIDPEKTGKLRKFHATVAPALQEAGYNEHDAGFTAMLLAQINSGYVTSSGQYNIASLNSMLKAAKAGKLLQNDAIVLKYWTKLLQSINSTTPGETFEDFFPDQDIILSRSVNGEPLHGLRLSTDDDGNLIWKQINRYDKSITLEDKKNFLKHKLIPDTAKKVLGMLDRNMSSQIRDSQKPDGALALCDMIDAITELGRDNLDRNIPFEERANPANDILNVQSGEGLKQRISQIRNSIYEELGIENPQHAERSARRGKQTNTTNNGNFEPNRSDSHESSDTGSSSSSSTSGTSTRTGRTNDGTPWGNSSQAKGLRRTTERLRNANQQELYESQINSIDSIISDLDEAFLTIDDIESLSNYIIAYFHNNEILRPYVGAAESIISEYRYGRRERSIGEAIDHITSFSDPDEAERIAKIEDEIMDLVYSIPDFN